MIFPVSAGAIGGAALIFAMWRADFLTERSGIAVLVGAIAFFYPVFAVQTGASLGHIAAHSAVFLGFAALSIWGFRTGMAALAMLLIAHGVFDIAVHMTAHSAPIWWPAFCAGLDITAGFALIYLIRSGKAAA